jgi:L-ascorbate metabolism protein UlaG (beta-lactamase superfamily)
MKHRNLDGSGPKPFGDVLKWALVDKVAGRRRSSPKRSQMPWVPANLAAIATAPAVGAGVRLTWLGHASWLVQAEGKSLLLDPVLGPSISGVVKRNVEPGVPLDKLPRIDATLVTHNHRDHFDVGTVKKVAAPVIVGIGSAPLARSAGVGCTELDWWQSANVGGLKVTFVPSQHWSGRSMLDNNEMLWGGFVIESTSARIYHSGDTAYFEGFKEIGRRFPALDAALLPIGAYDPEWFMRSQHMTPEDAVHCFTDLGAKQFVAMHWGTFKLTDEPLDEPPLRLREEWKRLGLPESALHIPPVGATFEVRSGGVLSELPAAAAP